MRSGVKRKMLELIALHANAIGHFAYGTVFLGQIGLAHKKKIGWWLRLIGEAIWVIIGYAIGYSSIWAWGALFCVMELYGLWAWMREDKQCQSEGAGVTKTLCPCPERDLPSRRGRCCEPTDGESRRRSNAKSSGKKESTAKSGVQKYKVLPESGWDTPSESEFERVLARSRVEALREKL
jgi:hypothetical protein